MGLHHERRSTLRARGHDYRAPGAYFLTFCVAGRRPTLSQIGRGQLCLTGVGELVVREWHLLPDLGGIALDAMVVMPDHVHAIVWLLDPFACQRPHHGSGPPTASVGSVVGQWKSRVTKAARASGLWLPTERLWQRGYHDWIIRSEASLLRSRNYIALNPFRWENDHSRRLIP